jgi:hypothetical protein
MTPFEKVLVFLVSSWRVDVWIVAKALVLLFLFLYFLFSLVVVRQVGLMSRTINGMMEEGLAIAAKILVGLALMALALGVIIL